MPSRLSAGQVRSAPRGTLQSASVGSGPAKPARTGAFRCLWYQSSAHSGSSCQRCTWLNRLGRIVAGVLDQRVVRARHVGEPAAARRLHALGPRLGDLRPGQAEHAADVRPGVAADQHRAALVGGVERQQLRPRRAALVGGEALAHVGDVPAEMPDRALRRRSAAARSTLVNSTITLLGDSSAGKPPQSPLVQLGNCRTYQSIAASGSTEFRCR